MTQDPKNSRTLLEEMFPSIVPIKTILHNKKPVDFYKAEIDAIFSKMAINNSSWKIKNSKTGKYIVLTVSLDIQTLAQLHKVYEEIGLLEDVVQVM